MATRRATACDDFVRIDTKPGCVCPDPANGGLAIGDAFERRRAVPVFDAVFSGKCHHPTRGQVIGLVIKLRGSATNPAAAEKEHYGWGQLS